MFSLTWNMPTVVLFLIQRISFQILPFVKYAIETRVESTTACLHKTWQIWHPSAYGCTPLQLRVLKASIQTLLLSSVATQKASVTTQRMMATSR